MSVFDEVNQDALTGAPDTAAVGPRAGFLESFETNYNAQVRASAMFGIEKAMTELDQEQVRAMRNAGIENVPALSDDAMGFFGSGAFAGDYLDTAKFYEDGGDPKVAERLKAYDTQIDEVRKNYPDLRVMNSRELWDDVRSKSRSYEQKQSTDRTTFMGSVGGFVGGAVGGMNVESDPLNFATIPLNAGRSVLGRIGFQGAAQGVTETFNQITGVQEERRLLGLSTGFADGLTRVGGAVVGGAALQAGGEALGAGFRRFFRNTPDDPAPAFDATPSSPVPDTSAVPQGAIPADADLAAAKLINEPMSYVDYLKEKSPWSVSRIGQERSILDLDHATNALNDWSGPRPFEMEPLVTAGRTMARGDYTAPQGNVFDRVANSATVDAVAREVDPETFRLYDKYADDKAAYQARMSEFRGSRDTTAEFERQARLDLISDQIDELKRKQSKSGAMKGKKYGQDIAALTTQREAIKAEAVVNDTPEMQRMRQLAMRADEKMRDLAEPVSRAYARARNKWDNTDAERNAIREMVRSGSKQLVEVQDDAAPRLVIPETLYDKVPMLRQDVNVKGKMPENADAATVAQHIIAQNVEALDAATETFRASLGKILEAEGPDAVNEITMPGTDYVFHLDRDKITVENPNGTGTREISVREYLQEQHDRETDLQAVTSCSIL